MDILKSSVDLPTRYWQELNSWRYAAGYLAILNGKVLDIDVIDKLFDEAICCGDVILVKHLLLHYFPSSNINAFLFRCLTYAIRTSDKNN